MSEQAKATNAVSTGGRTGRIAPSLPKIDACDAMDPIYEKTWSLESTTELMKGDHRERFLAEYIQLKIRYERLRIALGKLEACSCTCDDPEKVLGFRPTTPAYILREQAERMSKYLESLQVRAPIDGLDLKRIKYTLL